MSRNERRRAVWKRAASKIWPPTPLSANLLLALFSVAASYCLYAGRILGDGDALRHYPPQHATSLPGFCKNLYLSWNGSLTSGAVWGIFQRISAYLECATPLDFPWWLNIGFTQFSMMGAALNMAFIYHLGFDVRKRAAIAAGVVLALLYTANPVFYGYSLNPGLGMYPFTVYLMTVLSVSLLGRWTLRRQVFSYVTLVILFNYMDTTKTAALVFFIVFVFAVNRDGLPSRRSRLIHLILPVVLLALSWAITWMSPGFAIRRQYLATPLHGAGEFLERGGIALTRVVTKTYPRLCSAFVDPGDAFFMSLHWCLVVAFLVVAASLLYRERAQLRRILVQGAPPDRGVALLLFAGASLVCLYLCFTRTFLSLYHGDYADDNPSFFLLTFLTTCGLALLGARQQKLRLGLIAASAALLLTYVAVPNAVGCIVEYDKAAATSAYMRSAYLQTREAIAATSAAGDSSAIVVLKGIPEHNPYLSLGTIQAMLAWSGIREDKVYGEGVSPFDTHAAATVVRVAYPLVLPRYRKVSIADGPVLLRSVVHMGVVYYDYLVATDLLGAKVIVLLNPNLGGSPLYLSQYEYDLRFSTEWRGAVMSCVHLTLASATPGPPAADVVTDAVLLDGEDETDALPLDYLHRVVRIKVHGGYPPMAAGSSRIVFRDSY